jgi:hypothetical protein
VRTEPEQFVDLRFTSHPACHLYLDVFAPDYRLDRGVVVAQASRSIKVHDVDPFRSRLGEAGGDIGWIIRVDGRMRIVAAHETHAAAAQDVDGRDD